MKAIIKLDIPDFQIGQEVCVSFPDTMMIIGITEVATDTVDEFENIKAEIQEEQSNYTDRWIMGVTDLKYGFWRAYEESIKLINKHISELKGENNPDCRNCDKWKTCENGEKGHANGTSIGYSIGECRDYAELKGEQE